MKEFSENFGKDSEKKGTCCAIIFSMKKNFLFFIPVFLFFSLAPAFSDESENILASRLENESCFPQRLPPKRNTMNFNGRKMQRHEGLFSVIGVKTEDFGELLSISIFFNAPVDSNSIHPQGFLISGKPLPPDTEFLFNKPRNKIRFEVKKSLLFLDSEGTENDSTQKKSFSLKILFAVSFDGKMIQQTEIPNLEANTFYKFHKGEQKWQEPQKISEF